MKYLIPVVLSLGLFACRKESVPAPEPSPDPIYARDTFTGIRLLEQRYFYTPANNRDSSFADAFIVTRDGDSVTFEPTAGTPWSIAAVIDKRTTAYQASGTYDLTFRDYHNQWVMYYQISQLGDSLKISKVYSSSGLIETNAFLGAK